MDKIKRLQLFKANKDLAMMQVLEELVDKLGGLSNAEKIQIKGDKGDKGDPAPIPTEEEILAIIKPYIPDPIPGKDGHTPTDKELLSLIKPLIPKIKDGNTPTREELESIIKPLILKPKNGKDGKDGKDGSPDTPKDIKDKLESLKGQERLDFSAIKGLDFYEKKFDDLYSRTAMIPRGGSNLEAFLNDTKVGSGSKLNIKGTGITATNNGNTTTYDLSGALTGYVPYTGATGDVDLGSNVLLANGVNIGATDLIYDITLGGGLSRSIGMERATGGYGNSLQIIAGGAFANLGNADGGTLELHSGLSEGTGDSRIQFYSYLTGSDMSGDNDENLVMTILNGKYVGIANDTPLKMLHLGSTVSGENGFLRYSEPISGYNIDTLITKDDGYYVLRTNDNIDRLRIQQDGKFLFEAGSSNYSTTLANDFTFDGDVYMTNGITVQGKAQIGYYASVAFISGVAIGSQAISGADGAFALGSMAQAQGDNSIAIGYGSFAGSAFDMSFSGGGYVQSSYASSTILTVGNQSDDTPFLTQDNTFYIYGNSKNGSDSNIYPAFGGIGTNLIPRSLWEVGGSYGAKLEVSSTDFTTNETTNILVMDTQNTYVYLETTKNPSKWRQHTIVNASSGNITLVAVSLETIGNLNKTNTKTLGIGEFITVEADGSNNWYIINKGKE